MKIGDPVEVLPAGIRGSGKHSKYEAIVDRLAELPVGTWLPIELGSRAEVHLLQSNLKGLRSVRFNFITRSNNNILYLSRLT